MLVLSKISNIVFDENATALDLVTLALALAVFWSVFFAVTAEIVRPLVYGKPWLVKACERDYERSGKKLTEALGMKQTKQEFIEWAMYLWPWNQAVTVQHFVGGALCLPSVLGLADEETASSLACLGILSELGWEIQDMCTWLYKRFALQDGKDKVPTAIIAVLAVHHSLTTFLGIPLILHYRKFKILHWVCFDLQAAASVTLSITEYTKLLDVSKMNELRRFVWLTFVALAVSVWTRGVHWVYLCAQCIATLYKSQQWFFTFTVSVIALVFTVFNWVVLVQPTYLRFLKFWKASAEYTSLPETADKQTRRSSVMKLQEAAEKMFPPMEDELLAALFEEDKRENLTRRQTIPPSMFSSTEKRRSSLVMLRASAGDMSRVLAQMDCSDTFRKEE